MVLEQIIEGWVFRLSSTLSFGVSLYPIPGKVSILSEIECTDAYELLLKYIHMTETESRIFSLIK